MNQTLDALNGYRTLSVFLVPILDQAKTVLGVIQLINALDSRGRPVPFQPPFSYVQRTLALIQARPRWRLSLQLHKVVGVP